MATARTAVAERIAERALTRPLGILSTHTLRVKGFARGELALLSVSATARNALRLTTALMLRSVADIARSEGEDLRRKESRLACFQVFALGGRTKDDEKAEIGYYGLRITLGLHFENILEFAGPAEGVHIPAVIDLARSVAARFGVVIGDAVAVKMIPVAGAASGAILNLLFMQHYQDVARGHFIVRRLEREYGMETIKREYERLEEEEAEAEKEFSPVEGF